jgi:glycosyltransferase involved in cell wall biosynthesis
MKKIKVLGLALYGDKAASTRIRINQYKKYLEKEGILIETCSLLDNFYLDYKQHKKAFPLIKLFISYIRRAYLLAFKYEYDLILLHCELFPFLPGFFERFFLKNKKYIYDFDDAFYLKYRTGRYKFLKYILGNKFDRALRHADFVTAGSKELYDYACLLNKNVILLPSSINLSEVKTPNLKRYTEFSTENPLVLGWIGSPSTEKYLLLIKELLEEIGKELSIKLIIVGGKLGLISNIILEEIPWSEEIESSFLNSIDVGIMPLNNDAWARGKCGYKLIQYMGYAKPVIASKVGANISIVQENCGFLVNDSFGWKEAIMSFYNNPSLINEFGINSRNSIVSKFSVSANFEKLQNVIITIYEST